MAGQAKELRDEWEIKMLTAVEELNLAATAAPANARVIHGRIKKVESVFERLQVVHAQYCHKAKIGLGSSDSSEFLRGQVKMKMKCVTAAKESLGEDSEEEKSKGETNAVQDEMFQLQVDIEGKLASLDSMTRISLLTKEQYESIMAMLDQGEHKLRRYMECSSIIQEGNESTAAETLKKESQTFFKVQNKKLNELRCTFLSKAPIKTESFAPQAVRNLADSGVSPGVGVGKHPVKIKAMDCPNWDGKYRTFPRFKKLWEENIAPRYEDTALHYLICQALPKSILDNISTLSDSAEDIWKHLDNKYGKSDVVAREIMGELMSLDHKKLGKSFIGKFSTMLMDTHALLVNINEVEWLVSNRSGRQ